MNSSLQVLSACWPLTAYFLSDAWRKDINTTNTLGTKGRLAAAYAGLLQDLWLTRRSARA